MTSQKGSNHDRAHLTVRSEMFLPLKKVDRQGMPVSAHVVPGDKARMKERTGARLVSGPYAFTKDGEG